MAKGVSGNFSINSKVISGVTRYLLEVYRDVIKRQHFVHDDVFSRTY